MLPKAVPQATKRSGAGSPKPEPKAAPKPKANRKPKATPKPKAAPRKLRRGSPTQRLRVGFVLIAMLMSVFAARLIELQGVEASTYATIAARERLETKTLLAQRGDITDRSGTALATTVDSVAVTADPKLTAPEADRIAAVLSPLLDVSEADLKEQLTKPDLRFVYLARKVPQRVWETASSRLADEGLPGVFSEPDPTRTYPAGPVAANVVGFIGADGTGLGGLEYALDDELTGEPGRATYEEGAGGRQIPLARSAERDAVPGANVQLTLDRDVQWAAQQAIAEQVRKTRAKSGDIVVLDVQTGELVALATAPGYDPGKLGQSTAEDRVNRPLQDMYEPGSVVKVLTAAALLDAGYVTPGTQITVPGELHQGGERIKDYWAHGDLNLTFAGAIAKSSNVGTVLAAKAMPKEQQARYLKRFGIGEPTGISFPGETNGLLSPPEDWGSLERATISFGQGMAVNAVQMASAVAAIANGGVHVEPTLIRGMTNAKGEFVRSPEPERTRVVGEKAAEEVTAMMEAVTGPDGAAEAAAIPGYRVAGKTGTAQRFEPECGCYRGYTTSFAGFAPADSPRFLTYVVLQDPQGDATGSSTAAPVFADVMSFVLHKYGVAPSRGQAPDVPLTW